MTDQGTSGNRRHLGPRSEREVEMEKARDVLWDFHTACPEPTDEDVRQWQERHPEHADLIIEYASVVREDAFVQDDDGEFANGPGDRG